MARLDLGERVVGKRTAGQDSPQPTGARAGRLRPAAGTARRCGLMEGQRELDELFDLEPPQSLEQVTPPRKILSRAAGQTS
jgi:hypothetical protein